MPVKKDSKQETYSLYSFSYQKILNDRQFWHVSSIPKRDLFWSLPRNDRLCVTVHILILT